MNLARSCPLTAPSGIDRFTHFAEKARLAISIEAHGTRRTSPGQLEPLERLVEAGGPSTTLATERDYFSVISQMSPCRVARVK
jgi:hypothetical protein